MKPNKNLTNKQQQLIQLIEAKKRNHMPMVQRDLAEALGIRRDSLNKLLRRARNRLASCGKQFELPERRGCVVAGVGSLFDGDLA